MHAPKSTARQPSLQTRAVRLAMLWTAAILISACGKDGVWTVDQVAVADPVCKAAVSAVCLTETEIAALREQSARTIAKNNEGLSAVCPKTVKPCPKGPPRSITAPTKPAEGPRSEPSTS